MRKLALLFLFFIQVFALPAIAQQKVWLDADTGNEMDDVFAIIRLLWEDGIEVVGLSSAHFNNADLVAFDRWNQYPTNGIEPVRISQELNEEILATMGMTGIPHPLGADRQMGRAWGGYKARPSAATDAMKSAIRNLKPGEKLDILTLGALTNVASLIALDSTVKSMIRVYSLAGGYDFEKNAWNKNEFNVRCDLNAFDFMMNQMNLDWTVMPVHTVINYRFGRQEIYDRFEDENPIEQLMENRWRETNPQDKERVMWDLGLVQAYLRPDLATRILVRAPPENLRQNVKIYSEIDEKGMYKDFWNEVEDHRKGQITASPTRPGLSAGHKVLTFEEDMQYYMYYPGNYDAERAEAFPLLLFLHGGGESGDHLPDVLRNGPPKMAKEGHEFPFLMLVPQNPHKKGWWDTRVVMRLLDYIVSQNNVDTNRIYLTGLSRGGWAAWELAVLYPDRFAALAVVCGMAPAPYAGWIDKRMPIQVFHGEEDNLIPASESIEMVDQLKELGYEVELTLYPGVGHNSWEKAYANEELYEWMMQQKRE